MKDFGCKRAKCAGSCTVHMGNCTFGSGKYYADQTGTIEPGQSLTMQVDTDARRHS